MGRRTGFSTQDGGRQANNALETPKLAENFEMVARYYHEDLLSSCSPEQHSGGNLLRNPRSVIRQRADCRITCG
jgi:hypothetical protein